MVTVYGMNEKVGNVSFYDPQQENAFTKPYSDDTAKMIDFEVRHLIDEAYAKTKQLLTDKRAEVEILANALLEKEVLFQSDVEALIGKRPFEEKKTLTDQSPASAVSEPPASPVTEQPAAVNESLSAPAAGPAVLPPAFSDETESANEAPPY
jgi:cell division protease FtsH